MRAEGSDCIVEHAAIDAAAGQVRKYVRHVEHRREGMRVAAAPADVRENEIDPRMPHGEPGEIGTIRDLLRRPFTTPMLPDVMEYRELAFCRELGDRVQQRIIRATAREELDANCAVVH